jgi:DNA helicase-2/ATP-dependent DNA helicase PcrA
MQSNFSQLYDALNTEQQIAVDAIDGPVMVIAGPGTGKTQILAARILNILQKTDARPEDILCLTYTDAGAAAMRQRLIKFMGADASRVHIYTFHGLCNKIIQENPDKFALRGGDTERQRVMDELEKLDLMDSIIRNIPADSPIKNYQEDPVGLRWQLGKLFDLMQEENYTVEKLTLLVANLSEEDAFKAAFPDLVYKNTTKWGEANTVKRAKYDEYLKDWNKLLSAAEQFMVYQNRKKELGVYEFRDMIHWVLDALKTDEELLFAYQERFQYILVDEFQDSSGVQNEIVQQLISYWGDNPNCFVVGDDDQSIYAFQGARVSNMLAFANKYASKLKTVVLTQNYRSSPAILNAAEKVIQNNRKRLVNTLPGLSKQLIAAGVNATFKQPAPAVLLYKNRFYEAVGICNYIQSLKQNGNDWKEIAVIYSKHDVAEELAAMLRKSEIPFVLARSVNILLEPIIVQLCNWLEYLALELEVPHKGEYLLYEMLHYDLYDIEPFELVKISTEIYKEKKRWREFLAEYVNKPAQGNLFENDSRTALTQLWKNVESWLKKASSLTVPELVHQVIAGAGFMSLALQSNEREFLIEQLTTFLNFVSLANAKKPFLSLAELMDDIGRMRRNDLPLALEKRIGSTEGVVLTTAHGSKGLEFKHVVVLGAENSTWESDRNASLPFKLGKLFEGSNQTAKNETENEENSEERRRLFYVALTRAKESLTISYVGHKIDAKGTELQATRFLLEITGGAEIEESKIPIAEMVEAEKRLLDINTAPTLHIKDSAWLQKQIEGFKFSPSTLYDILDCGLKFYFGRIARIPSPSSASMGYGTAVHATLKMLMDYAVVENKPDWPPAEKLLQWFKEAMLQERRSFTRQSFETRLKQGMETLPQYYAKRLPEFQQYQVIQTERWFETTIEGVRLGGYLDKIIFNGNDVTIVDYKTGKSSNIEKSFKSPSAKSLEEGKLPPKYWFQLGLYQLIINHLPDKNWHAAMCQIDALDRNDEGDFPLFKQTYSTEDLQVLKSFIVEGQRKLNALEFLTGCGKPDCEWCQFAKDTRQVVEIPEVE